MKVFFKAVIVHFLDSDTLQKGAALAYYTVFSLLPMVIITVSLLGLIFGREAVSGEIYEQMKGALGNEGALQIQGVIKNQHINHNNTLTALLGFAMLALSATGMFSQIHSSFNNIWNVEPKPGSGIVNYAVKHVVSLVTLVVIFAIIFLSTSLNSLLIKYSKELHVDYELAYVYEHVISFVLIAVAFAIMFKFLSDAKVAWKISLKAGLFTSTLFLFGKVGIGMYIGHSHLSTTFGAMSTLALLMMWVYYTSQIIFLGASFLKVLDDRVST
ncbi:YihY/virulence factor BrkB family protein [Roseivirga sp. E12]|uniref:YihY/virulence factor BrkB family protein n=1 Tax=Roseivirga sp. E12 TaxID=2819237 RepID=UPI001ABC5455|nr:YihY/virulence factor BrkB family protein [Roseivirga sp. E12]MBO3699272.1 YihY/virulence factor BrkB family protein [Roseivirga sp. E12]